MNFKKFWRTTMSTYHDIEQRMCYLSTQDAELLRHAQMLLYLLVQNSIFLEQLAAEGVTRTTWMSSFKRG